MLDILSREGGLVFPQEERAQRNINFIVKSINLIGIRSPKVISQEIFSFLNGKFCGSETLLKKYFNVTPDLPNETLNHSLISSIRTTNLTVTSREKIMELLVLSPREVPKGKSPLLILENIKNVSLSLKTQQQLLHLLIDYEMVHLFEIID